MKIGQVYQLIEPDNPFKHLRRKCFAEVKDIKSGWVLYRVFSDEVKNSSLFQNETKTVEDFLKIYAPIAQ